jgi:adenylosuccinate synthase
VTPVIGNGVVIDLSVLFGEVDLLESRGIDTSRLLVSANAHLIAPYHTTIDKVGERFLGKARIGTTGRGIGPAYADKMSRVGVRVQDLFDEKILCQKVEAALDQKNQLLVKVFNRARSPSTRSSRSSGPTPSGCARTSPTPRSCWVARSTPAVPSCSKAARPPCSTSTTGPIRSSPRRTRRRAARAPARACRRPGSTGSSRWSRPTPTRVGAGPFPTELLDDDGERLRRDGAEFGTTTGRPARCGWYDAPIARFAARINGVTDFVLTKLDVLTGWERIPVCVAYDVDGVRHDELPVSQTEFHHAKPVYEELPGWDEDISGARSFDDLPAAAQAYVTRSRRCPARR